LAIGRELSVSGLDRNPDAEMRGEVSPERLISEPIPAKIRKTHFLDDVDAEEIEEVDHRASETVRDARNH
jgi:hypothetical protein